MKNPLSSFYEGFRQNPLEQDIEAERVCHKRGSYSQVQKIYQRRVIEKDPFTGSLAPTTGQIQRAKEIEKEKRDDFEMWVEREMHENPDIVRDFLRKVRDGIKNVFA